ncbi:MAG TPA: hypothetical protein VMM77_03730 [Gemmatimonadaceae bacterium]|nr:hypothetical protein [Gemmatimonadaceae bacterium]
MRTLLLMLTMLASFATVGCDRSTALAGLSEQQFVSTMASLRRIERDATLDTAAKRIARRDVLQERDLNAEALESAARALATDPVRANEIWARIDSLATQDTASTEGLEELQTGQ